MINPAAKYYPDFNDFMNRAQIGREMEDIMTTRIQNPNATTQRDDVTAAKRAKSRRVFCATCYATENAAKLERLDDYDPREDTTSGGYTYGDDWSGDDLRALCDIFGA